MSRTKDIIEVLEFGFAMQQAIVDSAADNKWTIMDYTNFLSVIPKVGPAVEGVETIPATLATLTDDERDEVMDYARSKFTLANKELEILIENTFETVLRLITLGKSLQSFRKQES